MSRSTADEKSKHRHDLVGSAIPTINLENPDEKSAAALLRKTCTDIGFFYLTGHSIPEAILEEVLRTSKALFELSPEEKKKLSDPVMSRGYTAFEEETLDPNVQSKGDTKEGYYIGRDVSTNSPKYNPAKLSGPNVWPCSGSSDGENFKKIMTRYFDLVSEVSLKLIRLLALAIGLPDKHYFDECFTDPLAVVRLLHYSHEKSSPEEGIFACGAHSDYGMVTLLLTDENSGLEILTKEKDWIPVPPKKGAFIVNLGDMLERWTNGMFMSTMHRVLTNGENERYSIPFFYEPNFDTVVECLDVCCAEDNPPKYPPTTSGQHLLDKYAQTHADFTPDKQ